MSSSSFATRKPVTVERSIGGKTVSIESGRLAKQASGAVVVRVGDTMTLVATVSGPGREGLDFFPLTVDYREKVYAAGKFPGGFIKREGRPTTKEILSSRLIDRPSRPLFPEGFRDEVQIQAGPISADRENDSDVLSIIGASASLILSNVPFMGPIGAVRLARVADKYIALPTATEMKDSDLDLIVASTDKTIVMIEGFGRELPEAEMFEAIMEAHRSSTTSGTRSACRPTRRSNRRSIRSRKRSTAASAARSAKPRRFTASKNATRPSRRSSSGSSLNSRRPTDRDWSPRSRSRPPSTRSRKRSFAS
jgi:polyribonucleotide nucleotidyltransferase